MPKKGFLPRVLEGVAAVGILIAGLGLISTSAKADVAYTVSGTFDDGAILTGSFTLNQYGFFSTLDLKTTAGTVGAHEWTLDTLTTGGCPGNCIFFSNDDFYNGGLQLTFASPLGSSAIDAIIGGIGGPSWQTQSFDPTPIRFLEAGVVTAVPEISTWAMLLLGFLGVGFLAHRRKASRAEAFQPA